MSKSQIANPMCKFVSRKTELEKLNTFLRQALSGNTQVCFITGEAGTGKTRLVEEFVRQSEQLDKQPRFAKGNCNAQTGISDPYLPFRSILGMLTGDNANAITRKNAQRLSSVFRTSGRFLVELAPDLVGTLIPGSSILVSLARLTAQERGLLKGLEKRANASEKQQNDIEQSQIFLQYTAFLQELSQTYHLVIILDDLQWVDAASNALFFHLVRELRNYPIFLIGLYRPNDVAMGRNHERHPLAQTLNEIKRIYGDVWIDLDQATQQNGRTFVEALVNSEPNHLSSAFFDTLFARTDGHALFTTELLRSMQERGDLVKDANGFWQESPQLNWDDLPDRLEAIIEERIERLENEELREILNVACVEGQDFTAQVIARIQELKERELVRKLSRELEHCHKLVQDLGEVKIGRTFLSRYTFSHALFQAYLYSMLSSAERRMLHREVADTLESLYGKQVDNVAVQLAFHYTEAGNQEKSATYLQKAGEKAYKLGELNQARDFFSEALASLESQEYGQPTSLKAELLWWMGETLFYTGLYDLAETQYRQSIEVARQLRDDEATARGLIDLASNLREQRHFEEGLQLAQEGLEIAKRVGNLTLECKAWFATGAIYRHSDRTDARFTCYEKALDIAIEIGDIVMEMYCLNSLGIMYGAVLGDYKKATRYYNSSLELAIQQQRLTTESICYTNIGVTYRNLGDYQRSEEYLNRSLQLKNRMGNIPATSIPYQVLGTVKLRLGDMSSAVENLKKSLDIAIKHGRIVETIESYNELIIIRLIQNQLNEAQKLSQETSPLRLQYQEKSRVFNDSLLDGIIGLRMNNLTEANQRFEYAMSEAGELMPSKRWSYRYHRAFAQVGIALLSPTEKRSDYLIQATEYFQEAVNICGWAGIIDDALLILREMQKADSDNLLQPIEDYLVEKREIAWKNLPFHT